MAWLEQDSRTGIFKVAVRVADSRLKRSLQTTDRKEAESIRGTVENTLSAIERGWLAVPEGIDLGDFLISGGKAGAKLTVPRTLKLSELFEQYFTSLPTGSLEESTLYCMRLHEKQLYRFFGKGFAIQKLTTADLQRYVEKRSKDKGRRGRKVTPVTIKKAVITLRTVWNWGVKNSLVAGRFPHSGVKYPKLSEKPHFQTWPEIASQVARGGLSDAEQADLWDCLFLTLPEIVELLDFVKANSRHPFIYPMFATAAHTGARKSELVRSRLNDIDLAAGILTIHERKRNQAMRTTRRVPLSPFLGEVLKDWLAEHPGGNATFCLNGAVSRSRNKTDGVRSLTRDETHDHFKRTLAGSKWEKLRGWHVFRHSFCSNCAATGIDQRIINAWVGHQTEDMVRRYRHLIPNQQQEAIQRVFGLQSP